MDAILEHAEIFEKLHGKNNHPESFNIVKKHFKSYAAGFHGAKELRDRLMRAKNTNEAKKIIENFLGQMS
jgi:tRNA-dihydrouridine synthase